MLIGPLPWKKSRKKDLEKVSTITQRDEEEEGKDRTGIGGMQEEE